jgi:hypothetical protein
MMKILINYSSINTKECIMKKLLFSLVVFSVLFVIGCQENSIIDPVLTEPINTVQKPEGTLTRGTIPLQGLLVVPGMLNVFASIEGRIDYTHEVVLIDPIRVPPVPQYNVLLTLSVNAVLTIPDLPGHNTWRITSDPEEVVCVLIGGAYRFERSYLVQGRDDGLALVCKYTVTTDGVSLDARWLAFSDGDGINKIGLPSDTLTYPPVRVDLIQ